MKKLEPLEKGNEIYFSGKPPYEIQLEIPVESTLTEKDLKRLLRICSWETDVNEEIDGYEGGRSVLIKKDEPSNSSSLQLNALQISGIGYNPMKPIEGRIYEQGDKIGPPSLKNFYDLNIPRMRTSGAKNNRIVIETDNYRPTGSYEKDEWERKIKNTKKASKLDLSFSVPNVEGYGRYLNLEYNGENIGFIVFSIPNIKKRRFAEEFLQIKGSLGNFVSYGNKVAYIMGKGSRELHEKGYVHRQLHFSNFYYFDKNEKLHIMDWSTLIPLDGTEKEKVIKRAIDIRIPHQNYEKIIYTLFNGTPKIVLTDIIIGFSNVILNSYFDTDDIDIFAYHNKIVDNGFSGEDLETIINLMIERFNVKDGNSYDYYVTRPKVTKMIPSRKRRR